MNHIALSELERARYYMVEQQIRPWDVLDSSILSLLSVVRREDFVPAAHQSLAFMDLEIPLVAPAEEAAAKAKPKIPTEAEMKAARDARYAARKLRNRR